MTDKDALREQADDYEAFELDLPFVDHPFNALKAHNVVFGTVLGTLFGVVGAVALATSAVAAALSVGSATATTSLALYAYGLDPPGVDPADAKLTIVTKQIKRKPHYFTGPLAASYAMILAIGLFWRWLF